jgi:hypothetical protein
MKISFGFHKGIIPELVMIQTRILGWLCLVLDPWGLLWRCSADLEGRAVGGGRQPTGGGHRRVRLKVDRAGELALLGCDGELGMPRVGKKSIKLPT